MYQRHRTEIDVRPEPQFEVSTVNSEACFARFSSPTMPTYRMDTDFATSSSIGECGLGVSNKFSLHIKLFGPQQQGSRLSLSSLKIVHRCTSIPWPGLSDRPHVTKCIHGHLTMPLLGWLPLLLLLRILYSILLLFVNCIVSPSLRADLTQNSRISIPVDILASSSCIC